MRYADPELAATACEGALGRGYTAIKLHEVGLREIEACRQAIGPDTPMSVDVNCAWSRDFVTRERSKLDELNLAWLEEPVFPPEDFDELRALRSPNLPLAAGENWCTAWQFQQANGAVDILQPSVTKVGGISEYLSIVDIARSTRSPVIPHCPYFGPGFYATLHLAAAHEEIDKIEILYVEPDAWLSDVSRLRSGDRVSVPPGPGLGFEPDPDVTSRYRRA
jgi:L-alanine-DL-glutamate epimerase-like enolase superfamily enzyme